MALAETAELAVKLTLGGNFQRQLAGVNRQLKTFDKDASRAYRAGQQIGTGIKRGLAIAAGAAGLIATQVALGLDSLVELERQTAQTNAVIKSTGGIAGVTAEQVGRLAEKYESLNATIGDEVIREGENLLLTFTNIRKDAFEPALEAALNMNTALGKGPDGLSGTVRILGKALNDPTKGLSALTRVGITFSKEQTKRIKQLQQEGDLYGAQSIILAELDKRFGGSFLAQGNTTAGKVAKFKDAVDDLQRSLATALLPAVSNVADALSELLKDPEVIKATEDLGREIGALFSKQNIKEGARVIGSVFQTLKSAAPAIKTALGTVGTVLKTAFDAFTSLPLPIQQLLIGGFAVNKLTGGLVTNIAGGIFGALKAMTVQAGIVNVTGGVVNGGGVPGGAGGKGGGPGIGIGALFSAGAILAIGTAIGSAVVDHFGGPTNDTEGQGRVIGKIGELEVTMGRNEAAIVRGNQANKQSASLTQSKVTALGVRLGRVTETTSNRIKQAQQETKRETARGATAIQATDRATTASINAATGFQTGAIVAALYATRPSISVTTINKYTTRRDRGGASSGSAYRKGYGKFGQ